MTKTLLYRSYALALHRAFASCTWAGSVPIQN